MLTKTDRRSQIQNKKKYARVHHGIGAWSPDFAHLKAKKDNIK